MKLTFFWKFTDLKMYVKLQHLIKSALNLSHEQAQIKPGFSSNKSLTADYMPTDNTVAICSVHDYLMFHNLQVHEVEKTKDLLESCRHARKKYFDNHRQTNLSADKTEKMEARKKVIEDIEIVNAEILWTLSGIENLKKSIDEIGFQAEKRTALG